jgi:hypothetical protein
MVQANNFLQQLVPQILDSPAYKDRGMLIITFDEAKVDTSATTGDGTACCNEQPGFNTPSAGGGSGPGGGRVGAVVLSPCITPGTETNQNYNHYSLLRSIEDNFGLPHLGYAGQAGLQPFGNDVLNSPSCTSSGGGGSGAGQQTPASGAQRALPTSKCKRRKRHRHHPHAAAARKHKRCKKRHKHAKH